MKTINDYIINEQFILEYLISVFNDYKIFIDISNHADDRQIRYDKSFISKKEIIYSIYKVAKDINDELKENIIKIGDNIKIVDKSRNKTLNIICNIIKCKQNNDYITIKIITEIEKSNMKVYDVAKTYTTYSSDKKIQNDVKLFKQMV